MNPFHERLCDEEMKQWNKVFHLPSRGSRLAVVGHKHPYELFLLGQIIAHQ